MLVVLLFHELGHAIHDVVSKTEYARFHGPGGTVIDFGEAPSQMLENWCFIPEQLRKLSKHYSYISPEYLELWKSRNEGEARPPEQVPDFLIERIVGRQKNDALHYLGQISMSLFDMAVYQPKDGEDLAKMDFAKMWNDLRSETCSFDNPSVLGKGEDTDDDYGNGYTNFRHIIKGDYDAGYYSYLL